MGGVAQHTHPEDKGASKTRLARLEHALRISLESRPDAGGRSAQSRKEMFCDWGPQRPPRGALGAQRGFPPSPSRRRILRFLNRTSDLRQGEPSALHARPNVARNLALPKPQPGANGSPTPSGWFTQLEEMGNYEIINWKVWVDCARGGVQQDPEQMGLPGGYCSLL